MSRVGAWTAVAQQDGHPLSEADCKAIVRDGVELFEHACTPGAPTVVAADEPGRSLQIPGHSPSWA